MLIGSIISGIISFFLNSYYTGKRLGYSSWMQLKDVAPSYVLAFFIAMAVFNLKYLPLSYVSILLLQMTVGSVALIVVCEITKMEEYKELKGILLSIKLKIDEFKKRI